MFPFTTKWNTVNGFVLCPAFNITVVFFTVRS